MRRFCEQLRELLTQYNLTQKVLSEKLGLGKNKVHCWVCDITEPSLEDLAMVAKFFDVTTDYLIGLETLANDSDDGKNPLKLQPLTNVFAANTQEERELLKYYRKLSPEKQENLINLLK